MATHVALPRPPPPQSAVRSDNLEHQRPLATRETAPPPLPKSIPPRQKKIVLPSPPPIIRDHNRGIQFQRHNFLGEGGFARVYEVSDANDVRHAVKVVAKVNLHSKKSKTKLYAEIKLHRALKHPNIVLFGDCFEDDDHVYMSMELCQNGSLNDLLRKRKRYTEPETRFFVMQIIGACHYMHTHQVIHRDLKLGNIFLDRHMNVKVGDFGLAALIETPGDRKKTICGTPNYIAPEVLFDTANGHSFEVDTWSIGVILYTLIIGKPPFQTADIKSIYDRIKHNNYDFPVGKPISPYAQALVTEILTHDPGKRPTLYQIIDSDFFTQGIFPRSIPISAYEAPPAFNLTKAESQSNYRRVRRAAQVDDEDTEIRAVDVVDSGSLLDAASAQQQQKQEREFNRAVQPGSPISVLLKSAREPLLVSKSPLRAGISAREMAGYRQPPPLPTNALLKKLSAAKVQSALSVTNAPFPQPPPVVDGVDGGAPADRVVHQRAPSTSSNMGSSSGVSAPVRASSAIISSGGNAKTQSSSIRQPLQALPTLQEEREEARRQYDLASQKARIVKQMASASDLETEDAAAANRRSDVRGSGRDGIAVSSGRDRDRDRENQNLPRPPADRRVREREREPVWDVPIGKGLAEDETERIKPIMERRIPEGKSNHTRRGSVQTPPKLRSYEEFSQTLNSALTALEGGVHWRRPADDQHLRGPKIFIQSWVDYCNKYGMGYALTNGCVGVHFNDSTTMVISADKHNFEYSSLRGNGVAFVRKHYTVDQYPADLKSKVYLLKHFERYILDKLLGNAEHHWEDLAATSDLTFVHKYLRMTNVLLFKLSNDVLQLNFFDHTKLILSNCGLHLIYFDKHNIRHSMSLAFLMHELREHSASPNEDKTRLNGKILRKLTFCRDLLTHILTYSGSRLEESVVDLDPDQ